MGPLTILSLAEFDPANALSEHRAGLRAAGVDYRLAVAGRTTANDGEADWILEWATYEQLGELVEFAARADVVQVAPAIGQPWSAEGEYVTRDVETFGPLHLAALPGVKVVLFHGSVSFAEHGGRYIDHFTCQGYSCWSCSPRWARWFSLRYVPAWVSRRGPLAAFRRDGEALRVVHSPTDIRKPWAGGDGHSAAYQHTQEFLELAAALGVEVRVFHGHPHAEVLDAKRTAHAAFDHLSRGTFSMNTLESCALGIVPLFGWNAEMRDAIGDFWPPHALTSPSSIDRSANASRSAVDEDEGTPWGHGYWPAFPASWGVRPGVALEELRAILTELRDDAALTRRWQAAAARFGQLWCAETLAPRLAAQYGGLVGR